MSIWDDPEMRVAGEYVSFNEVGDSVSGKVIDITAHYFDEGRPVPKITLDTGDGEVTLTAGQVRLQAELKQIRPEIGDTLTVKLTEIEKRSGGKTLKHFHVDVVRGTALPTVAATPTMTPEQLAAVELLKSSGMSA